MMIFLLSWKVIEVFCAFLFLSDKSVTAGLPQIRSQQISATFQLIIRNPSCRGRYVNAATKCITYTKHI